MAITLSNFLKNDKQEERLSEIKNLFSNEMLKDMDYNMRDSFRLSLGDRNVSRTDVMNFPPLLSNSIGIHLTHSVSARDCIQFNKNGELCLYSYYDAQSVSKPAYPEGYLPDAVKHWKTTTPLSKIKDSDLLKTGIMKENDETFRNFINNSKEYIKDITKPKELPEQNQTYTR